MAAVTYQAWQVAAEQVHQDGLRLVIKVMTGRQSGCPTLRAATMSAFLRRIPQTLHAPDSRSLGVSSSEPRKDPQMRCGYDRVRTSRPAVRPSGWYPRGTEDTFIDGEGVEPDIIPGRGLQRIVRSAVLSLPPLKATATRSPGGSSPGVGKSLPPSVPDRS